MKKAEYIKRFGEAAWVKKMAHKNELNAIWMKKWHAENLEIARKRGVQWKRNNPEKIKVHDAEISRKGGKYYEKMKQRRAVGIPHEKSLIRGMHNRRYRVYRKIIAPESELNHQWLNDGSAGYSGVALVEANAHRHGIIKVIQILEGKITLFTEREIAGRGGL